MKNLLIFIILIVLAGCESINTQKASKSINHADSKNSYNACFIIDKKLLAHSTVISTPEFMDNNYGFMAENHFKKDSTINLKVGEMIADDIHAFSNEMFANQCLVSSPSELNDQANLIITVDLVSSSINAPKHNNDTIVSQIGILYTFYDAKGIELFKTEVFEENHTKASSPAAYRKVVNETVDKAMSSSKVLISRSLNEYSPISTAAITLGD